MIDRLASLAALGPGLSSHANNSTDIQKFAQRRVDHLREKVKAGDIDPQRLQDRLISRFGDAASDVVGEDGAIDFEELQDLITTQQATKLQGRLEGWFGDDARGIVGPDGKIDRDKFYSLHAAQDIERLQARLSERFGDRADGVVGNNGSIDVDGLRELFASQEDEPPYEPAQNHDESSQAVNVWQPFFYAQTGSLSRLD